MKLLLLFLLASGNLFAQEEPWKEGLHLYAGGGPNISSYHTEGDTIGPGLHFKTDFGYSFKDLWAIEAGSFVKFAKVHDTLIWDTSLVAGLKRRLPGNYFAKIFAGQAPTVFFTDDNPEIYRRTKTSRILYTGPVAGFSLGRYFEKWFWETTASYQSLDKARGVREGENASEEVFRTDTRGVKIISVSVSFGIVVF